MLKPGILRAFALLTAAGVLCVASNARADLLGRSKPRKTSAPVASAPKKTALSAQSRAQSPAYEPVPAGGWQQPQATTTTPWYESWNQGGYDNSEICCGPPVKHTRWKEACRRKCHQSFYCSTPPYCMPCYGYNTTCWRRMPECTVCPREPLPVPLEPRRPIPAKVERKAPPAEISTPPAAEEATPPEAESMRRRTLPLEVAPVSSQRETTASVDRSRWTGFADALGETDEIPEAPLDTPVDDEEGSVEGLETDAAVTE